jgi:hypothetical protein
MALPIWEALMDIATGRPEDHPTPLPLQDAGPGITPVAGMTATGQGGVQVGVFDAAADQQSRLAGYEADIAAAQAAGHAAELGRRDHYNRDILPQGSSYGDEMALPPVPANAVPAEASDLYPWSGMEPTPASAGLAGPYPTSG